MCPIVGLTDRDEEFPQIGVIRKGDKKPAQGNRPGADLKYFRVELDERETRAAQAFKSKYGEQPTDIVVVLPFNDISRCWEAWREAYVAGGLVHRCDNEWVEYAVNPRTGEKVVINGRNKAGNRVACDGKSGCKPVGRLRVIVPELKRLAYLIVMTTSTFDILNISKQLRAIATINSGRIAGIPLVLRRRPHMISTPSGSDGKKARREKWLISIEADPDWVAAKLDQMQSAALPSNVPVPSLPTPTVVAPTSPSLSYPISSAAPDWGEADDEDDEGDSGAAGDTMPPMPDEPPVEGTATLLPPEPPQQPQAPQPDPRLSAVEQIGGVMKGAADLTPKAGPTATPKSKKPQSWPSPVVQAIVKAQYAIDARNAVAMLNLSHKICPDDAEDVILTWVRTYLSLHGSVNEDSAVEGADNYIRQLENTAGVAA